MHYITVEESSLAAYLFVGARHPNRMAYNVTLHPDVSTKARARSYCDSPCMPNVKPQPVIIMYRILSLVASYR